MKPLSKYLNTVTSFKTKVMKGFFDNVGGNPVEQTKRIINNLWNIKDYKRELNMCINYCTQFPVGFGMHISSQDKQYQIIYIKNSEGTFDWWERGADWQDDTLVHGNKNTDATNIAGSFYIVFCGDYDVNPCYLTKDGKIKDL